MRATRHARPIGLPGAEPGGEPVVPGEVDAPLDVSDAELGVGVEDEHDALAAEADSPSLETLLADEAIAPQVMALVERRAEEIAAARVEGREVAALDSEMGALIKGLAAAIGGEIAKSNAQLAAAITKSNEAQISQQPGYVKPFTAEELEARAAANIEMEAILKDVIKRYLALADDDDMAAADALVPQYLLLEDAYLDHEVHLAGETIRFFQKPGTYMKPKNAIAEKVSALMWRFIGGPPEHAQDMLAQAVANRGPRVMGLPETSLITERSGPLLRTSRVLEAGIEEVGPLNTHGTIIRTTSGGIGSQGLPHQLDAA